MQIVHTVAELKASIKILKQQKSAPLGLTPTMGNLHAGHLYLLEQSIQAGLISAVSIFVNPTQFNNADDLTNYPRTLEADLEKLKSAGCDLVFVPNVQEMYPKGMQDLTQIAPASISHELEGAFRPGHFNGMATVVCKLFNLFSADVAFFGQKDFQQLAIVKQMVADLNVDIEIRGIETRRESSGLALSSRNSLLSEAEKQLAANLYESLKTIAQNLYDFHETQATLEKQRQHLTKLGFVVDYLEVREATTLQRAKLEDKELVVLVAAYLGQVRLIDNLPVRLKVNAL